MAVLDNSITIAGHPVPAAVALGAVGAAVVAVLVLLARRAARWRPIPGIPYNKEAAERFLGDTSEMRSAPSRRAWFPEQFVRHNSPIVQVKLLCSALPRLGNRAAPSLSALPNVLTSTEKGLLAPLRRAVGARMRLRRDAAHHHAPSR